MVYPILVVLLNSRYNMLCSVVLIILNISALASCCPRRIDFNNRRGFMGITHISTKISISKMSREFSYNKCMIKYSLFVHRLSWIMVKIPV